MLKEFGILGEEVRRQELQEFVRNATFQRLFEADDSIRVKTNPVKTAYNRLAKIRNVLAGVGTKICMDDVEGCLVEYFSQRWRKIEKE